MRYTVRRLRKRPTGFRRTTPLRTQENPIGPLLAYYIVIVLCFKQVLSKML